MSVYQDLLKPINEALMEVSNIKDSNRGSPVFNQLSAVAEGFMVSAWVTVDSRTYKHVEQYLGSAQFFGNRVLKDAKDRYVSYAILSASLVLTERTGTLKWSSGFSHTTKFSVI